MSAKQSQYFNDLKTIANWQLDNETADVGLPALQRGYVWKPKQVETLWDSLLRGFPIGSFLVSENEKSEGKKDLLDGQQRATAIAMGFYNPWDDSKHPQFFSNKFKNVETSVPVLWLDIGAKDEMAKGENGDCIFLPRLITQSHPWGYNRNGDILRVSDRKAAIEKFTYSDFKYPQFNLKNVFPWISELPVPMAFLIEAFTENFEIWQERLIEKCKENLFRNEIKSGVEISTYYEKLEQILSNQKIRSVIEFALSNLLKTTIPIITLKKSQLEEEAKNVNEDASTLFVRINTAGTRLNGEELIYSMYKNVFPYAKDIVEDAGTGFISPSRIITHISRIIATNILVDNREYKFAHQLKFREFKNRIEKTDGDFYIGVKQFIEDGENSKVKSLFLKAKEILVGPKEYQLPYSLAVEIARNNDIFFLFLYWIYKSNPDTADLLKNEFLHKKILAAITTLCWFSTNTSIFLNEFGKVSLEINKLEFWNTGLFKREQEFIPEMTRWLTFIPNPIELRNFLDEKFDNEWEKMLDNNPQLVQFRQILFIQKGLLLFVQRKYLKERFSELQWETLLEDSNRPFDWDHIYPSVYNQKDTYEEIRNTNNTIGNLRAWALGDNRGDQDGLPKKKLAEKSKREDSFINDNSDWEDWERIDNERITKDSEKAYYVCHAIYTRISNIYENWYKTLSVNELFSDKQ